MSDDEGFFARWSRRKRDATQQTADRQKPEVAESGPKPDAPAGTAPPEPDAPSADQPPGPPAEPGPAIPESRQLGDQASIAPTPSADEDVAPQHTADMRRRGHGGALPK